MDPGRGSGCKPQPISIHIFSLFRVYVLQIIPTNATGPSHEPDLKLVLDRNSKIDEVSFPASAGQPTVQAP